VDKAVARLRAFAAAPEMLAIRWALPWSFAGLAAGLIFFMAIAPSDGSAPTQALPLWAVALLTRFYHAFAPAFGVMSAALVVLLTFDLARRRDIPPGAALPIASAAFVLSLPYKPALSFEELLKALGSSGLFLAIITALIVVNLLAALRKRFGAPVGTLAAAVVVVAIAGSLLARGISLSAVLAAVLAPLGTLGDSLAALLIITLIETLLWTVGIHGPALLAAVVLPVYIQLQAQNTEALAHGLPLPHVVTVATFLFVFPGGAGATLPLVLLLLRSRVRRTRRVAMATLVPAIFNANEPLMFGLPLVSNPYLCVPFVIAPLVLALVTWEAIHLGLVARPALYVPSSIPLPFSVLLATKDWRAAILVAVNVSIALAIYAPFVRLFDRHELSEPTG
jgi:PTS system cellobiose-specific IIC component